MALTVIFLTNLQTLVQLFAAIYFSMSVEGLANKLYKVVEKVTSKEDDIERDLMLCCPDDSKRKLITQKLFRCAEKLSKIDKIIVISSARLGFLLCLCFLVFTGYGISGCESFCKEHLVLTALLLFLPVLVCWLFFNRPCRWITRTHSEVLKINSRFSNYLLNVMSEEREKVDDNELRSLFLKGKEGKKSDAYIQDVQDWGVRKYQNCVNRKIKRLFLVRCLLSFEK